MVVGAWSWHRQVETVPDLVVEMEARPIAYDSLRPVKAGLAYWINGLMGLERAQHVHW